MVSLDLTIINSPTVDLGNDVSICQGDSVLLDAGSGHTNYLWNTGDTTQTIYADTAGTYNVTVGNGTPVTNNNSLSFDGQDDYVELPQQILQNSVNNFTINTLIKPDVIIQTNPGNIFYTGINGEIHLDIFNNGILEAGVKGLSLIHI